jgi:RNA polymerase sigma factor (sigma-70 family)
VGTNGRVKTIGVTPAELREAERGFILMLRRKFSAVWIAENAKDLLAQASFEYVEWLADNPPARNPVGWLLTCAYRRALNLLDSQTRKPPTASLDSVDEVFHLADESTPTPEEQALDHDRQERLRNAMRHLPEKECKLLALVYFHDHSIREAGRKVGWQKSAADRHHDWAMEKLRALVGDDRSLLSPATLGPAAWVAARGEGHRPLLAALDAALTPGREAVAIGTEAVAVVTHRGSGLWRRISPFTDPSSAAATSGGGRVIGSCGVALATVVCGVAASGVVPIAGNGMAPHSHKASKARPAHSVTRQVTLPVPEVETPEASTPKPSEPNPSNAKTTAQAKPRAQQRAGTTSAPAATSQQVANEFGVESGSAPEPASSPAPETSSPSGGSSGRSSGGSSGSSAGSEFAM